MNTTDRSKPEFEVYIDAKIYVYDRSKSRVRIGKVIDNAPPIPPSRVPTYIVELKDGTIFDTRYDLANYTIIIESNKSVVPTGYNDLFRIGKQKDEAAYLLRSGKMNIQQLEDWMVKNWLTVLLDEDL